MGNKKHTASLNTLIDEVLLALSTDTCSGFDLGEPLDGDGNPASQKMLHDNSDNIIIVCICKSGRHRSVAIALCLEHALANMDWKYIEVIHLEKNFWPQRGCQRQKPCALCDTADATYHGTKYQDDFLAIFSARSTMLDEKIHKCLPKLEDTPSSFTIVDPRNDVLTLSNDSSEPKATISVEEEQYS